MKLKTRDRDDGKINAHASGIIAKYAKSLCRIAIREILVNLIEQDSYSLVERNCDAIARVKNLEN